MVLTDPRRPQIVAKTTIYDARSTRLWNKPTAEQRVFYNRSEMTMITNARAGYDYEVLETLECGIVLESWEVKAIAAGRCSLGGTFCRFIAGRLYLTGVSVGNDNSVAQRERLLLLHRREIAHWSGKVQERGLSLVPLRIYPKNGKYKVLIALAKGKKHHDKRAAARARDIDNEMRRIVKSQKLA